MTDLQDNQNTVVQQLQITDDVLDGASVDNSGRLQPFRMFPHRAREHIEGAAADDLADHILQVEASVDNPQSASVNNLYNIPLDCIDDLGDHILQAEAIDKGAGVDDLADSIRQAEAIDKVPRIEKPKSGFDIEIDSRCICRVSPHLHGNTKQVYHPVVLSLGPYHHGKPEFSEMEKLKQKQLDLFMSESEKEESNKGKEFYRLKIMEKIKDIRGNYEEVKCNNEELAEIILRDACFLIRLMEPSWRMRIYLDCIDHGGLPTLRLMGRDFYMLENQIPFWIIKYLTNLRSTIGHADKLVCEFIRDNYGLDCNKEREPPWKGKTYQPLHLLEAHRAILMEQGAADVPTILTACLLKCKNIWKAIFNTGSRSDYTCDEMFVRTNFPSRSVTYLQSKGIRFKPSSNNLQEIRFKSYYIFGILHLPILIVDTDTDVLLSNIVAFEMSSITAWEDGYMLSYVNFMKSLIHTVKDVIELRERGILDNTLETDEEVVNLFKGIHTYGANNVLQSFKNVKEAINKHCNSKGRTWMADLAHTYCRSPWAAIAILVTTLLLSLTMVQTYYAVHPVD